MNTYLNQTHTSLFAQFVTLFLFAWELWDKKAPGKWLEFAPCQKCYISIEEWHLWIRNMACFGLKLACHFKLVLWFFHLHSLYLLLWEQFSKGSVYVSGGFYASLYERKWNFRHLLLSDLPAQDFWDE